MIRFLIIIFFGFLFIDVSAQNKKDLLYQDIILSCYDMLSEYEKNCSFSNEDRKSDFKVMFESSSNLHTNDIPAMNNYNTSLSIDDYIKKVRKYYTRMNVDVKVNSFSKVEYFSDQAEISVFVNKSISGASTNDLKINSNYFVIKKEKMFLAYAGKYVEEIDDAKLFDTKEDAKEKIKKLKKKFKTSKYSTVKQQDEIEELISYEDNFNLRIDFLVDLISDSVYNIQIKKVDLVEKKSPLIVIIPYVSKFYNSIFKKKNKDYKYNMQLEYSYDIKGENNKEAKWTTLPVDGYFLSLNKGKKIKIKPKENLYYKTYEIDPSNELIDANGLKELKFLKYSLSAGFSTIFNSNNINFLPNSTPASFVINQFDFTKNLDFKAEINLIPDFLQKSFFLNVSFNFSQNLFNHDILVDSYSYSINDIDPDGSSYLRNVQLDNIIENQTIESISKYLNIVIGNEFKIKNINKTISASLSYSFPFINNLLFKENYRILSTSYSSSADALYSGYYEDLAEITISENGVYDFGNYQISGSGNIIDPIGFTSTQLDVNLSFKIFPRIAISADWRLITFKNNIFDFGDPQISKDFNELNSVMNISPIDMQQSQILFGANYSL